MSSDNELYDQKQYTYCPECGKLMKKKESDNRFSNKLCAKCKRKYRPRY